MDYQTFGAVGRLLAVASMFVTVINNFWRHGDIDLTGRFANMRKIYGRAAIIGVILAAVTRINVLAMLRTAPAFDSYLLFPGMDIVDDVIGILVTGVVLAFLSKFWNDLFDLLFEFKRFIRGKANSLRADDQQRWSTNIVWQRYLERLPEREIGDRGFDLAALPLPTESEERRATLLDPSPFVAQIPARFVIVTRVEQIPFIDVLQAEIAESGTLVARISPYYGEENDPPAVWTGSPGPLIQPPWAWTLLRTHSPGPTWEHFFRPLTRRSAPVAVCVERSGECDSQLWLRLWEKGWDTRSVANGAYALTLTVEDTRGRKTSKTLNFRIAN